MNPPAPALRLGWLRFLIGGYAWVYTMARLPAFVGVLRYRESQYQPVGPFTWVEHPLPPWLAGAMVVATAVLGLAFWLGWRFRWTGPAFAVALTLTLSYRNSWGMVFHTENLMLLHVIVLGLSRSADACSLDAGFGPTPTNEQPLARYGWPIRLMAAVTVLVYLLAGIAKLKHAGWAWITSDALLNFVAYDNVRKIEMGASHSILGGLLLSYKWLFPPLAAVSLALELGAPIALLRPHIARVWAALAWSFHLGVLIVMFIFFHYPLLGFAFMPFFDVERWGEPVRAWARQRLNARASSREP